jgi:hypothetical protein
VKNKKSTNTKKTTKRSSSSNRSRNVSSRTKSRSKKGQTTLSRVYRAGKRKSKNYRSRKKVLKNNKEVFNKAKNVLIALAVVGLISSVIVGFNKNEGGTLPITTVATSLASDSTTNSPTPELNISKDLEKELLDYKNYCYYGYYQGAKYLYCPEEYVLKLAEFAIEKINKEYESSGKLSKLENGKYIPDIISPELVASICMMESSYRIEKDSGLPLGADRNVKAISCEIWKVV